MREGGGPDHGGRSPAAFTLMQFTLCGGVGLVAFAGLLASGLAFGLAMAGAACLAGLLFAVWFIVTNLVHGERATRRQRRS